MRLGQETPRSQKMLSPPSNSKEYVTYNLLNISEEAAESIFDLLEKDDIVRTLHQAQWKIEDSRTKKCIRLDRPYVEGLSRIGELYSCSVKHLDRITISKEREKLLKSILTLDSLSK
jgi:hypothetical protein